MVGFEAVGATTYPLVEFPNCDAPVIITPKSDRRDYPDGLCHTYQVKDRAFRTHVHTQDVWRSGSELRVFVCMHAWKTP